MLEKSGGTASTRVTLSKKLFQKKKAHLRDETVKKKRGTARQQKRRKSSP